MLAADVSHRGGNEMALGGRLSCECYDIQSDNDRNDTKDNSGVQLTVERKASDAFVLTSISGFRQVESDITIDFDGERTDQTAITANGRPGSRVAPGPCSTSISKISS
jgi:hypothetical protein